MAQVGTEKSSVSSDQKVDGNENRQKLLTKGAEVIEDQKIILNKNGNDYKVITLALDLTGPKYVDEICQIGAFTIKDKRQRFFAQYVMPYRDVSTRFQMHHGIKTVIEFGPFRCLKDARSWDVIPTNTEYAALNQFLNWLSEMKGDASGIILAHHGNLVENTMSYMVQALERYKLTNAFFEIVHGSIDCNTLGTPLLGLKSGPFSMRSILKQVLGIEEGLRPHVRTLESASARARIILNFLSKMLMKDEAKAKSTLISVCISKDEILSMNLKDHEEHATKARIAKSLRPIFFKGRGQLGMGRRLAFLRKYLVDIGVDYDMLNEAYKEESKAGLIKIVAKTKATGNKENSDQLIALLVKQFEKDSAGINSNALKDQGDNVDKKELSAIEEGQIVSGDEDDDSSGDEESEEVEVEVEVETDDDEEKDSPSPC